MKTKRRSLSIKTLEDEKEWVLRFTLTYIKSSPGAKIPMREVYEKFCDYMARSAPHRTKLTIDGFGRLFPKNFVRKTIAVDGKTCKGLLDVQVTR